MALLRSRPRLKKLLAVYRSGNYFFRSMLNLFLFAGQSLGQRTLTQTNGSGPDFEVTKCNRQVDNEPEMTIRFSHDYFEDHLLWQVDEFTRSEYGYEKTIPEDELLIDFTDDCKSIFMQ